MNASRIESRSLGHLGGIATRRDDTSVGDRLDPGDLGQRFGKRCVGRLCRPEVHGPRPALAAVPSMSRHTLVVIR